MSLKARIDADIKSAMLGGDKGRADILRGLKSAILYEEVATGKRDDGLDDASIEKVVARESKKREEAATLYEQGGSAERASVERQEKEVISVYLPQQLSDEELTSVAREVVTEMGVDTHQGKIIGAVKAKVGNAADGARIAAAVQKALSK